MSSEASDRTRLGPVHGPASRWRHAAAEVALVAMAVVALWLTARVADTEGDGLRPGDPIDGNRGL